MIRKAPILDSQGGTDLTLWDASSVVSCFNHHYLPALESRGSEMPFCTI